MEREKTVDSYSESVSSDDEPSNVVTISADSDSSKAADFEDAMVGLELDPKKIKIILCQIATGLKTASDGYLNLASCISHLALYELLQIIAKVVPPPMDVVMPIKKALLVDGKSKTVSHLIHSEYTLTNMSWSKLQEKYQVSWDKVYTAVKGKKRPGGTRYQQKDRKKVKTKAISSIPKAEAKRAATVVKQEPLD